MPDYTQNAPLGQPVCHVNEWLNVLKDAAQRSLIDPADAAQIKLPFDMGLLAPDGLKARILDALRAGPAAARALDALVWAFDPSDVIELRALDPATWSGTATMAACAAFTET